MSPAALVLLVAACGCFYAYAGYPLLLVARAMLRPRPPRRSGAQPLVTIIVPAHNEENTIGAKLSDLAALRYPPERLEVIVASDGSSDRTEAIARTAAAPRVRLLSLPRRGKLAALDAAVRAARGDVLVFTDANVRIDADALRYLVQPFADPAVGCVCGEKRSGDTGTVDPTARGEGLYWRYDAWIKRLESVSGTLYGADGALYAIRRSLYRGPAEHAQADDLAISGRVALQGHRIVYEPRALCFEALPCDGWSEFRRKVRVVNHTLRAILDLARTSPRPPGYWFTLVSHKVARYAVPVLLAAGLAATATLSARHPAFLALLELQVAFYLMATAGWLLRARRVGRLRVLSVPYYFSLINAAALVGALTLIGGRRTVAWTPRAG